MDAQMLKAFCDSCGEPATAPSKRFEKLEGRLGLEAVLLFDGTNTPGHHICDECFPKLLLEAAKSFPDAKIITRYKTALVGSIDYSKLRKDLVERAALISKREKELDTKIIECGDAIKACEEKSTAGIQQIAVLDAQLAALNSSFEARVRREVAAQVQARIDAQDNPEYVNRVGRREALRASGSAPK
jgi:hypothetical protein